MKFKAIRILLLCMSLPVYSGLSANDTSTFNTLVESYIASDDEEIYRQCTSMLNSGEGDISEYFKGLLFTHRALKYVDVSLDSVTYFIDLFDFNLIPEDKERVQVKYNRALGLAYAYAGQFEDAIALLNDNISLTENLDDVEDIIVSYSDVAIPYYFSGNTEQALEFWKKAVAISIKLEKYQAAYNNALNIAFIHGERHEIDSAYKYKDLCISLVEKKDVEVEEEVFYLNMGVIAYYVEHYEEAVKFFDQSKKESLLKGNQKTYIKAIANASSCFLELGDPQKSLEYLHSALNDVKSYQEKAYIVDLYSVLSRTHYDLGNYKTAYDYLDSSKSLKDELINETRTKQIAEMQEKFKSVEKDKIIAEQELAFLNEKNAKEQEELKNKIHERDKWYLYFGIALVALFGGFMYRRFVVSQSQKKIIEKQKGEVEAQKSKIEVQHHLLEEVHHEISDSIKYAEKLQLAILPDRKDLIQNLGKGFVLFMPKDVVSGDFYWTVKKDDRIFFAAADCTGHGVPGAMVSVVCSNALNRAVNEMKLYQPAQILNKTRELVIETFARSGQDVKDGMDIALCLFDKNKLSYAGANNPLWIVRKRHLVTNSIRKLYSVVDIDGYTLIEVRGDRQPVGLYSVMEPFTLHELEIFEGDAVYTFTDGYADQFGGKRGKKMKYKVFKEHLLRMQSLSMDEQRNALEKIFIEWKSDYDQIDDVCVIGVSV